MLNTRVGFTTFGAKSIKKQFVWLKPTFGFDFLFISPPPCDLALQLKLTLLALVVADVDGFSRGTSELLMSRLSFTADTL